MSSTVTLTGAQALVRLLELEGAPAAYGIVGGKLAPLIHALSTSTIPYLGVRHEASAAIMAAAAYASTGRVALAFGEMGPGGLNLAAGAGVAFNNHLAALLVTTNQHRAAAYPHRGMFMDLDTRAVLAPLTRWNATVNDVQRLPELVRTALRHALGGRPGPVHLDIPHDVLNAAGTWTADEFEIAPQRYRAIHGPRPAPEPLAEALALLRNAKRPLLVAGGGVVQAGADALLRELAARLSAPVVPTQMALGVVPTGHASFIGHGGIIAGPAVLDAFERADVVLALGCRFSSWLWDEQGPLVRRSHALINVNTDAAALGAPALHSVAIQADARLCLADLLAGLPEGQHTTEPDWLPSLKTRRAGYESELVAMAGQRPQADDIRRPPPEGDEQSNRVTFAHEPGPVMHPAALAQAIAQALPDDALAIYDGGHTSFWSNDLTPVHAVRTRFHDPGMCQLGFGLPYALALQALHPGQLVVNITGDGSFGFSLQELDTARRYRLAVVNVIHNNAAWGIIRQGQRKQFDFELGSSLEGTDYAAIAQGFGCHGEVVHDAADIRAALARARASGLPAVLDCHTRFVPHPAGPAFASMNRFGQVAPMP